MPSGCQSSDRADVDSGDPQPILLLPGCGQQSRESLPLPLPYLSPHTSRHGHAVHALKMAKDGSALKAVSQNLMHENLSITDGVYAFCLKQT